MEFKKQSACFDSKNRFSDDMRRFVCDEAARFTTGSNEAASASIDEFAEKSVRFSAEKHKSKAKEKKQILEKIKAEKEELLKDDITSIHHEEGDFSSSSNSREKDEKSSREEKSDEKVREEKVKELDKKQESVRKEKDKETKKAGAKTAVASVFKAKKDLTNDLVSDKATGNAFTDGMGGLMKTFVEAINPMRYVKKLMAYIAALLAPYIGIFMVVATIVMIIVMFIFSILQPIAEIGEALGNFLSIFSIESPTFQNTAFTDDEIQEIIDASGADETQEAVIRYALSKVGYPYSQANRCSGTAYDCSSLAYYSWQDASVDISYGTNYPPSAAEGARMLEADGKSLSIMSLKPGDLIYYGGSSNGRYKGIYHVAIYVGEGYVVEALNETYGVVYQTMRTNNAIMVCRPNG